MHFNQMGGKNIVVSDISQVTKEACDTVLMNWSLNYSCCTGSYTLFKEVCHSADEFNTGAGYPAF
jgi:hypothetical protein